MVLKKRLESRMIGFEVPRAPRSSRRKGQHKKIADGKHLCPIELLASLAGKLLQESESSSASNNASDENDPLTLCENGIKEERRDVDKPLKVENLEQGSWEESTFVVERCVERKQQKCEFENYPQAESDHSLECTSVISGAKPVVCSNIELGKEGVRMESTNKYSLKHSFRGRAVATNEPHKPFCADPARMTSFSRHRTDANLVDTDGDENFPRSNKCSNKIKGFRYHQRIGDHMMRKLLSFKYWRAAPKLRDCEFSKADGDAKSMFVGYKRKAFSKRDRYPGDCLYKKRKMFDRSSIVTSDGIVSGESNSNIPQKSMNVDEGIMFEGGTSASISGSHASLRINDANVKFSIKSLKIPELFIDVPETATVSSLKIDDDEKNMGNQILRNCIDGITCFYQRTIVEAVNSILGSGLRVGVVLQGKKIRDDNRTLLQSGLSCQENIENLGFTLEPVLEKSHQVIMSEDPQLSALSEASHQLTRVLEATDPDIGVGDDAAAELPPLTDACDHVEDNPCENIPSLPDNLVDNNSPDCTALVPLSAMEMEPLPIVPANQKNKRSELSSQRRIRRPFSVMEVEALVHAVEELGTGRWRDVKLRSFENVDHRTYVDLKDKWKTLVHTASISPQQRRGEPVPQELLDRVLFAHAYWTQHQGKQHANKHSPLKIEGVPALGIKVGGT